MTLWKPGEPTSLAAINPMYADEMPALNQVGPITENHTLPKSYLGVHP